MHFVRHLLSLISSYWGKNCFFFRIFEKWKALKIHHENRELFYDSVKFLQKKWITTSKNIALFLAIALATLCLRTAPSNLKAKPQKCSLGFLFFFNLKTFLNLGVLKLRWLIPGRVFFWEVWAKTLILDLKFS